MRNKLTLESWDEDERILLLPLLVKIWDYRTKIIVLDIFIEESENMCHSNICTLAMCCWVFFPVATYMLICQSIILQYNDLGIDEIQMNGGGKSTIFYNLLQYKICF